MAERFTHQQMNEFKSVFNVFKSKSAEKMEAKDLKPAVRSLGMNPNDGELQELINSASTIFDDDVEANGFDFMVFIAILGQLSNQGDEEEEMKEAFRIFDKDGKGAISRNELRHVMTNLGEKLTDEEVDEMIREADVDGDGQITYEEFVQMLRN